MNIDYGTLGTNDLLNLSSDKDGYHEVTCGVYNTFSTCKLFYKALSRDVLVKLNSQTTYVSHDFHRSDSSTLLIPETVMGVMKDFRVDMSDDKQYLRCKLKIIRRTKSYINGFFYKHSQLMALSHVATSTREGNVVEINEIKFFTLRMLHA